jgi:hypothetical protein
LIKEASQGVDLPAVVVLHGTKRSIGAATERKRNHRWRKTETILQGNLRRIAKKQRGEFWVRFQI